MKLLRSLRVRLFLVTWIASGLFFAFNIVREHYPAFALVEHGDLRCDEWAGLSPDLFCNHIGMIPNSPIGDGHWYANNQVGASIVAAPVLFLFRPLLDYLETVGKRQAAADRERASKGGEEGAPPKYDSAYPMRQKFMAEVRSRGLHLRFAAAAALCSLLVMAPLAGVLALLVHAALLRMGIGVRAATRLALTFPFVTPLLFRSAILNHNQMETVAAFASFVLIWPRAGEAPSSFGRRLGAGLLAGATLLFDFSGVVVLGALALYAFVVESRREAGETSRASGLRRMAPFTLGAALAVALLCFTQWWQFGDPFLPAQRWMPDAHFSVRGWHGFDWPDFGLLFDLLFSPNFGLFAFAPLLALAFLPRRAALTGTAGAAGASGTFGASERRLCFGLVFFFLLFSAANQFSRLQWNTGFRGLAPLVPFLFLLAAPRLAAWPLRTLALAGIHSVVLAMARATPPTAPASPADPGDSTVARCWSALFDHGPSLPWLTVWRQTQPNGGPWWASFAAPLLITLAALLCLAIWRAGLRGAESEAAR